MLGWLSALAASPTLWTSVGLSAGLAFLLYWYMTADYRRWEASGIPIVERPTFPFGNMRDVYFMNATIKDVARRLYNKMGTNRYCFIKSVSL